jgi:hypothetical protein
MEMHTTSGTSDKPVENKLVTRVFRETEQVKVL